MELRYQRARHAACVNHEGKLVYAFVAANDDGKGDALYGVRRDGFEQEAIGAPPTGDDWETPIAIPFPDGSDDISVLERERERFGLPSGVAADQLLRSVYRSTDLTELAPVRLVSAMGHLYVFRQGPGRVLANRFVLDGQHNKLIPKLELRYRRSGLRHRPAETGGTSFDSLSTSRIGGGRFLEPTLEVGFLGDVSDGRFDVTTAETTTGTARWHFASVTATTLVLTSVAASEEGWFDLRDSDVPAIIEQAIPLASTVTGAPSITTYAVQRESEADGTTILLKAESRLMVSVPTEAGLCVHDFALATNGTLSDISDDVTTTRLRGTTSHVMLPPTSLTDVEPIIGATAAASGRIQEMRTDADGRIVVAVDDSARRVDVGDDVELSSTLVHDAAPTVNFVHIGELARSPVRRDDGGITLTLGDDGSPEAITRGTRLRLIDANGRATVVVTNRQVQPGNKKIVIAAAPLDADAGTRVVLHDEVRLSDPAETLGAYETTGNVATITPGDVTGYRIVDGSLRVQVPDHDLDDGTIVGVDGLDTTADGVFEVLGSRNSTLTLDGPWPRRRLVDPRDTLPPRLGVSVLDGDGFARSDIAMPEHDATVELWVRVAERNCGLLTVTRETSMPFDQGWSLFVEDGLVVAATASGVRLASSTSIDDGRWHHLSVTFEVAAGHRDVTSSLCVDGYATRSNDPGWAQRGGGSLIVGMGWHGSVKSLRGDLAEIRVWDIARSHGDIAAERGVDLSGREPGLVGYWRCRAVVPGTPPQIVDFTEHPTTGDGNGRGRRPHPLLVTGAMHSGVTRLPLALPSGTPVAAVRNDSTYPVTAGARYSESFEYHLDGATAADDPPFRRTLRGLRRRASDEWVEIAADHVTHDAPVLLDDGWTRMTTHFTVAPESGITLMRTFHLADLQATADTEEHRGSLLLRNHELIRLHDTISRSRRSGGTDLADADGADEASASPGERLDDVVGSLEMQLVVLDHEIARLERVLDDTSSNAVTIEQLEADLAAEQDERSTAEHTLRRANAVHQSEIGDPINYQRTFILWTQNEGSDHRIEFYDGGGPGGDGGIAALSVHAVPSANVGQEGARNSVNLTLRQLDTTATRIPDTPQFVEIRTLLGSRDVALAIRPSNTQTPAVHPQDSADDPHLRTWIVDTGTRNMENGSIEALIQPMSEEDRFSLDLGSNGLQLEPRNEGRNDPLWKLTPGPATQRSTVGNKRITAASLLVSTAEQALLNIDGRIATITAQIGVLRGDRTATETAYSNAQNERMTARVELAAARQRLIAESDASAAAWHDGAVVDARGLSTRTTVLPQRILGDVQLRSLPEGDVEALGADDRGRVLRVRYDAVADSATSTFEQWMSPDDRLCVQLDSDLDVSLRNDPVPLHADGWTTELWFFHAPLPSERIHGTNVVDTRLVSGPSFAYVLIRQTATGSALGSELPLRGFADCGADLDQLDVGWHHLAVRRVGAGRAAVLDFFIDGHVVGEITAAPPAPGQPDVNRSFRAHDELSGFGQRGLLLADARVWDGALRNDEISSNAMNELTGREPGLVSWHPLDGINDLHNRAAGTSGRFAAVTRGISVPFSARVGHPGRPVLSVVGRTVRLPSAPIAEAGAVDFWIRFGHTVARPSLGMVWLEADSHVDGDLDVPLPNDADWHHVAIQWNSVRTLLVVSVDGVDARTSFGSSAESSVPTAPAIGEVDATVAEVRIWERHDEVSNLQTLVRPWMHRRPPADTPGLLWALESDSPNSFDETTLRSRDNRLPVSPATPLTCDQVVYASLDDAMLQRATVMVSSDGLAVRTGQRIGRLELEWIGNAQFRPTILGYIEGAPPVPSENLTVDPASYLGASSVQLATSEEVQRSWTRTEVNEVGVELSAYFGPKLDLDVGLIKASSELAIGGEFSGSATDSWESTASVTETSLVVDRLDLVGSVETTAHFAHLGERFVPKNVGYAVVSSGLADVYVTRLAHTGRMMSYVIRHAEDVPIDVNTITFMMNPAYTMNGSLDGFTGSEPTSSRFFPDIEEMRRRYGWRYPASFYRIADAYELVARIEEEEKRRLAYFDNFDVSLIGLFAALPEPEISDDDTEEQADQVDAAVGELRSARLPSSHAQFTHDAWLRRQDEIRSRASKRNIVNTYVWDADGGLRAESQQFAASVEQHFGSSVDMKLGLGIRAQGDFTVIAGAAFEFSYLASARMTRSLSKTEAKSRGFELDVDLSGVERLGVTDFKDRPLQPGEKVDRYRFNSYYLDGAEDHFRHFFDEVVDQEWLASNDEEARALREVDRTRPNKPWRVLHRVTYVERPALHGLDRTRQPIDAPPNLVRGAASGEQVERLGDDVERLRRDIEDNRAATTAQMDEVLKALRALTRPPRAGRRSTGGGPATS